ncbi:MAG: hypothetical protein ACRDVN_13200 [Jiangellaceae bacterium]
MPLARLDPALVLTEVNPDHVPDPAVLRNFVERLTATLAPR